MVLRSLLRFVLMVAILGNFLSALAQEPSPVRADKSPGRLHFGLMQAVEQFDVYAPKENVSGTVNYRGASSMSDLGQRLGSVS
jgi:hypothetical protein